MAAVILCLSAVMCLESNSGKTVHVRIHGSSQQQERTTIYEASNWRREILGENGDMILLSLDGAELRMWHEFENDETYILFSKTGVTIPSQQNTDATGTENISIERCLLTR